MLQKRITFWYTFLCLFVLSASCTTEKGSKPSTAEGNARKAIEAYVVDFWINRDTTALSKALTKDMVYHYLGKINPGDPSFHKNALREFGSAFPDMKVKIDLLIVNGDMGAAFTSWEGTQNGTLYGIPPSGRKVSWTVSYFFRMRGNLIAELWEDWNEGGTYYFLKTGNTSVLPQ